MTDYTDYPGLAGVYLEDSYVLAIDQAADRVSFALDAVLTPDSPAYHEPPPGDRYCFAHGDLVFDQVSEVDWIARSHQHYSDATGEEDLGSFDSLTAEGDSYLVEGDFGRVRIYSATVPHFELRELDHA